MADISGLSDMSSPSKPELLARGWTDISNADTPDAALTAEQKEIHSVSVVQFNTLADGLADAFPFADPAVLRWPFRSLLLKAELEHLQADIICLEEVDHFDDFFEPLLKERGYSGVFQAKQGPAPVFSKLPELQALTGNATASSDSSSAPSAKPQVGGASSAVDTAARPAAASASGAHKPRDGLAVFVRDSRYTITRLQRLIFTADSPQVALLMQLDPVKAMTSPASTSSPTTPTSSQRKPAWPTLFLVCTHLKAKEGKEDIRLQQAQILIGALSAFIDARDRYVIVWTNASEDITQELLRPCLLSS